MAAIHVNPNRALHHCPPSMRRDIRVGQDDFHKKVDAWYDQRPEIQSKINSVKVSDGEMQEELRKIREAAKKQ